MRILMSKKLLLIVFLLSGARFGLSEQPGDKMKSDIRALYNHDADVRQRAAQRLTAAGLKAAPLLTDVVCNRSKPNFDLAWPFAAKALGDLRVEKAAPCLVQTLGYHYPPIGSPVSKTDDTLQRVDPAFAALLQIGAPAVPAIRSHLPFLSPDHSLLAMRILRIINTPEAKKTAEEYIKMLEDQIRLSKQILAEFESAKNSK